MPCLPTKLRNTIMIHEPEHCYKKLTVFHFTYARIICSLFSGPVTHGQRGAICIAVMKAGTALEQRGGVRSQI